VTAWLYFLVYKKQVYENTIWEKF